MRSTAVSAPAPSASIRSTSPACVPSDIKAVGQDSQAIAGWNGPGPFIIDNNYLEGAGENILRYMSGMGTRDSTGYTMTPDWADAEAAMLRAGRAFNAEIVSRIAQ